MFHAIGRDLAPANKLIFVLPLEEYKFILTDEIREIKFTKQLLRPCKLLEEMFASIPQVVKPVWQSNTTS